MDSPEIERSERPGTARSREILTGAESAARAGEDQYAGIAGGEPRQGLLHLAVHLDIEAVELVGSIQGQPGDAIVDVKRMVSYDMFPPP